VTIVYDPPTRFSNLDEHGLDFADHDEAVFAGASLVPARRGRLVAVGRFRGRAIAVVIAPLGSEAVSIVSMRPASAEERRILVIDEPKHPRAPGFVPGRGYSREDRDAVCDNPELTEEELARAPPFAEVFPELATSIARGAADRHRPSARSRGPERLVSLRLDPDAVDRFKAGGPGWQARMNAALRKAAGLSRSRAPTAGGRGDGLRRSGG